MDAAGTVIGCTVSGELCAPSYLVASQFEDSRTVMNRSRKKVHTLHMPRKEGAMHKSHRHMFLGRSICVDYQFIRKEGAPMQILHTCIAYHGKNTSAPRAAVSCSRNDGCRLSSISAF